MVFASVILRSLGTAVVKRFAPPAQRNLGLVIQASFETALPNAVVTQRIALDLSRQLA